MALDVASVRRDFPVLSRMIDGKPLVYLDSASSAQKPQPVLDAIPAQAAFFRQGERPGGLAFDAALRRAGTAAEVQEVGASLEDVFVSATADTNSTLVSVTEMRPRAR